MAAIDVRAARLQPLRPGDREVDAATEINAIGAAIGLDQHCQRMAGAGLGARGLRNMLGRLAADFARDQPAVKAESPG